MKHNLSPNNTVIGSDHPATPIVSLGGTDCAVTRSLFSYAYGGPEMPYVMVVMQSSRVMAEANIF